ncbi:MAG: hypothetical protein JWN14_2252 [Chthonomonadales bacterium]|nr:hypothetical protein [Chthonomonadales bacterium]
MSNPTELNLPPKSEEFQKFEELTRRLFAVPIADLDEQIRQDNKQGRKRQAVRNNQEADK